ncbi:hypothetical protein VSS74_22955 [Conexibacter stalactiti]|uniref:Lipoprotein n=1 Tax=Conexibacter stalactiti TaxID=1940611 RepID=A0ABU4HVI0_9ACTN|nr:hypothetical protein [Conexibacter stalactiti]MDW5597225.1 hypothetical protein [Conexibacter stalactiti]MEC5037867.1 hypothetical protein [Conexibacter stalactiti]
MGHHLQDIEAPDTRAKSRRMRLSAGAVALLLAGTLAACGGDDSSDSTTTSAASGSTTEQTAPAETTETTAAAEDNGVAELSGEEILAAARDAAKGATAVHVAGVMEEVELDISLVKGEGATGRITQGGAGAEIIVVGDEIFLKGDERFYESLGGEAVVRLLGDKWLKVPAGGDGFESFEQITDMETLLDEALRPEGGTVEKGETSDVDGTPAIGLTSGERRGTLFVATTGEPFPLKIVGEGDRGEITFDGWNEPVELEAPTDVIDVAELQRAGSS